MGGLASSLNPLNANASLVSQELERAPGVAVEEPPSIDETPPTYVKATGRIVASKFHKTPFVSFVPHKSRHFLLSTVGDLHGDWAKAVGSLRAANVIRIVDDDIIWTGGDTVVVQLGDVLDRGDHEIGMTRPNCKCDEAMHDAWTHG